MSDPRSPARFVMATWGSVHLLMSCLLAASIPLPAAAKSPASDIPMPVYRADSEVTGIIQVQGSRQLVRMMTLWAEGFRRQHPAVYFDIRMRGTASAMPALEESVADLVLMARQIAPYDTYGLWRRSHTAPIEIRVATGSFDRRGKAGALTVFVAKDNPIEGLTLDQLDGIFGAQRTGGWDGMAWKPESARGADQNLTAWGQLGLGSDWMVMPITPYGPPNLHPGGLSFFRTKVLKGSDATAERYREYADREKMMELVGADRTAIAHAEFSYRNDRVRPVPIAEAAGQPYVMPTAENVRSGSYPLARSIYAYLPGDAPNGDRLDPPIEPRVREFLRYVLSREGQDLVEREGDLLALTSEMVASERAAIR